jgi:hypothetical protein
LEDTPEDDALLFYVCPTSCTQCLRCYHEEEAVECREDEDPGEA